MKSVLIFILIFTFTGSAAAQKPKPVDDRTELEAAVKAPLNSEKAALLEKFVKDHPKSKLLQSARESLVVARAAYAEEILRSGKGQESYELFAKAINEAPEPISDKLFDGAIGKFPSVLYWAGQRKSAFDLAALIETRSAVNAHQLQSLAMFYLSTENGTQAKKLAEAAVTADPESANTYETLGLANRLNFDLEAAAIAYAKAVELDGTSISAKLSLAEMQRALGKPAEATALYKEILEANPDEAAASSGLVLSLFDEGKGDEAETQLALVTEKDDKNFILLSSVAYWYATNGNGEKAAELAQKAIDIEPRYIWSHIALGRALIAQGDPVAAEKILVAARRYANIPTLEYEIASARFNAGFYREAAEELSKSFEIEGGNIRTLLGRRIERSSDSFTELVGYERRASIFEPKSSASQADDEHMKALFAMVQSIDYNEPEPIVAAAADKFVAGDDKMNIYRRLFTADILLDKNVDIPKAAELTESTIGRTDDALSVAAPSAAVMASELYESRTLATARGEFLVIPTVPKQTLSAILRGRVELLSGRALFSQKKYEDATIRYRRAISVLPENSAWWRSAWWRLGESLQASGNGREALDAYVKSYKTDKPGIVKYAVVAALYERVNGTKKGLEALIGENPLVASSGESTNATPEATPEVPEKKEPIIPRSVPTSKEITTPSENTEVSKVTTEPIKELLTETSSLETSASVIPEPTPKLIEPTKIPEDATVTVIETPDPKPTSEKAEDVPIAVEATERVSQTETNTKPTSSVDLQNTDPNLPVTIAEKPEPDSTVLTEDPTSAETQIEAPKEKPRSAFDPVVIIVGKNDKPTIDSNKLSSIETPIKTDEPKEEVKPLDETETEKTPKNNTSTEPDDDQTGNVRKRVIDGLKINEEVGEKCSIYASQDSVSILNDGGNLGILIGIGGVESKDIKITNHSPDDISVSMQPDISGAKDRGFFVIRSRSTKTGIFDVVFSGSCGSKTIPVTVR